MAEVALKHTVPAQSATVRERLHSMDDAGVVGAFLGGEERAFQELVERYQTRLLNFVFRTIGDRERAEDLVQEVFIRVYRHLHRFDRSKKFSTWIYTIASNLAKNELRNRSRNPLVLFQAIRRPWQEDDRPLDQQRRPDRGGEDEPERHPGEDDPAERRRRTGVLVHAHHGNIGIDVGPQDPPR